MTQQYTKPEIEAILLQMNAKRQDIILKHGSDLIFMSIDEAREVAAHIDEVGL